VGSSTSLFITLLDAQFVVVRSPLGCQLRWFWEVSVRVLSMRFAYFCCSQFPTCCQTARNYYYYLFVLGLNCSNWMSAVYRECSLFGLYPISVSPVGVGACPFVARCCSMRLRSTTCCMKAKNCYLRERFRFSSWSSRVRDVPMWLMGWTRCIARTWVRIFLSMLAGMKFILFPCWVNHINLFINPSVASSEIVPSIHLAT